jgi:IclR family KDG regulon transcriptional repressor
MSQSQDVKSASRVIQILELLSHHRDGLTFTQLHNKLQIPKSSLSALLATIEKDRWIDFDAGNKAFKTGLRAWETSQRFVRHLDLAESAEEHLIYLRNSLNMTVHLAIRDGRDVVYVSQMKATTEHSLPSHVGGRLPASATALGKALLGGLSQEDLAKMYNKVQLQRFTEFTVTDFSLLAKEIQESKARGFAQANGDFKRDVFCVAAPIRNNSNQLIAAISCTISKKEIGQLSSITNQIREVVMQQAEEISQEIGATVQIVN